MGGVVIVSPAEEQVLALIDHEALHRTLAELITFQSTGGNETPIQNRIAEIMGELAFEVDHWDIDLQRLRKHPAYTPEIERDEAVGVVGSIGGSTGPKLILNGHIDVVPAGDASSWNYPPWEGTFVADRIYGRGSVDMKGALCCALYAAKAVFDSGFDLKGSVKIQSVIGEEDGGIGTLATIARGHTGDAAIVLEPTQSMIAPAQAGALNFRIVVPGRAAHGALRTEGVHPMDHFMPLYNAIRRFEYERDLELKHPLFEDYDMPFPVSIGKLWAGEWPSSVPDKFVCEGRIGVGINENSEDVRLAFEAEMMKAAKPDPWLNEHPPVVEWWGAQFEPASIDVNHELVRLVSHAHSDMHNISPRLQGMPYGSDMRLLVREAGIPTLMYGPGDIRRAHAPDEYVTLSELKEVTETLVLCIMRYCG